MQGTLNKIENNLSSIKGKRVLLRLDLNVPIDGNTVRDDFRIQSILPTLKMIKDAGARTIILSHLESEEKVSLKRVCDYMQSYFSITFVPSLSELKAASQSMKDGDIYMLENLRVNDGEKANDTEFSKKLALCGDVYVNDAFAVSHRKHASIVGLPKLLPSFAGPLLSREIESLSIAFNPPHPFVFILAGAKFETKLPLVMKFIGLADHVVLAGALANDIYREKGYEVGISTVSAPRTDIGKIAANPKVFVPRDVVVETPQGVVTKGADEVLADECIVDSGASSVAGVADIISNAKLVLWNGPLGNYEKGFSQGTKDMAKEIVECGAKSVVGGGDTVAAIRSLGLLDSFSFVSTGGGAMLDFLVQGTLPGIEALKN